jgi:hypothetical protein
LFHQRTSARTTNVKYPIVPALLYGTYSLMHLANTWTCFTAMCNRLRGVPVMQVRNFGELICEYADFLSTCQLTTFDLRFNNVILHLPRSYRLLAAQCSNVSFQSQSFAAFPIFQSFAPIILNVTSTDQPQRFAHRNQHNTPSHTLSHLLQPLQSLRARSSIQPL